MKCFSSPCSAKNPDESELDEALQNVVSVIPRAIYSVECCDSEIILICTMYTPPCTSVYNSLYMYVLSGFKNEKDRSVFDFASYQTVSIVLYSCVYVHAH